MEELNKKAKSVDITFIDGSKLLLKKGEFSNVGGENSLSSFFINSIKGIKHRNTLKNNYNLVVNFNNLLSKDGEIQQPVINCTQLI